MAAVKVCGLTRTLDVEAATRYGADAVGFVFTSSPRQVAMGAARELIARAKRTNQRPLEVWGVFANEPVEMILQYFEFLGLDAVQLHGPFYGASEVEAVRKEVAVIRGLQFSGSREDHDEIERSLGAGARAVLLDAKVPGIVGGSGCVTDWVVAAEAALKFPVILSGGLSHRNVAEAIRAVRPLMVDASSGLEIAPGIKDPALIARFIAAVNSAV